MIFTIFIKTCTLKNIKNKFFNALIRQYYQLEITPEVNDRSNICGRKIVHREKTSYSKKSLVTFRIKKKNKNKKGLPGEYWDVCVQLL